jgi:hypothetical protein
MHPPCLVVAATLAPGWQAERRRPVQARPQTDPEGAAVLIMLLVLLILRDRERT